MNVLKFQIDSAGSTLTFLYRHLCTKAILKKNYNLLPYICALPSSQCTSHIIYLKNISNSGHLALFYLTLIFKVGEPCHSGLSIWLKIIVNFFFNVNSYLTYS